MKIVDHTVDTVDADSKPSTQNPVHPCLEPRRPEGVLAVLVQA